MNSDYTVFIRMENDVIPMIGLRSGGSCRHGSLVIIYGGSKEENFRFKVAGFLGSKLAELGFRVYCFDFRSNLCASRFHKFGLYDRLQDAREVVRWILKWERTPLSLMGISMGGPLAVTIAAELKEKVRNLFLIAPAAYAREVMNPEMKFGPQFSKIIRGPESWRKTDSFEEAKCVLSHTLIIQFLDDRVVPRQVLLDYRHSVGEKASRDQFIRLATIDGPHNETYLNSQRHDDIIGRIRDFIALPYVARD